MANTTNFGWETPDDTDLVKDGASAIRTLGSAIDTSLVDLKGGTTGQVLSKASNTDMDFTWVAQDDSNAIQNAIVDAKGDLITATAADTPSRIAVGTNGQYLSADSTTATGLKWVTPTSGGLTEITSGSVPSSTEFTISSIPGTYNFLYLRLSKITNTSGGTFTRMRFNNDGNTVYDDARMEYGNTAIAVNSSQSAIRAGYSDTSSSGYENVVYFYTFPFYAVANTWKWVSWTSTGGVSSSGIGRHRVSSSAITSITIFNTDYNFNGGTYTLWGGN